MNAFIVVGPQLLQTLCWAGLVPGPAVYEVWLWLLWAALVSSADPPRVGAALEGCQCCLRLPTRCDVAGGHFGGVPAGASPQVSDRTGASKVDGESQK